MTASEPTTAVTAPDASAPGAIPPPDGSPGGDAEPAQNTCARTRSRFRAAVLILTRLVTLGVLIWGVGVWSGRSVAWLQPGWTLEDLGPTTPILWLADLGASTVVFPIGAGMLAIASAIAVGARWPREPCRFTLVIALASVAALAALPMTSPRAAAASLTSDAMSDASAFRVAVFNTGVSRAPPGTIAAAILALDADVVAVFEPHVGFQRALRDADLPELDRVYPHRLRRPWVRGALDPAFLLSKHPIEALALPTPIPTQGPVPESAQLLSGVVRRPAESGGPVYVLATHPFSPRGPERWLAGNRIVMAALDRLTEARAHPRGVTPSGGDLPVVFLADLNAAPGSVRDGHWTRAGLRRAKPRLVPGGTYALSREVPTPRIAIDDAFLSEHWAVTGWSAVETGLSDHLAVVADLALRPEQKPGPN